MWRRRGTLLSLSLAFLFAGIPIPPAYADPVPYWDPPLTVVHTPPCDRAALSHKQTFKLSPTIDQTLSVTISTVAFSPTNGWLIFSLDNGVINQLPLAQNGNSWSATIPGSRMAEGTLLDYAFQVFGRFAGTNCLANTGAVMPAKHGFHSIASDAPPSSEGVAGAAVIAGLVAVDQAWAAPPQFPYDYMFSKGSTSATSMTVQVRWTWDLREDRGGEHKPSRSTATVASTSPYSRSRSSSSITWQIYEPSASLSGTHWSSNGLDLQTGSLPTTWFAERDQPETRVSGLERRTTTAVPSDSQQYSYLVTLTNAASSENFGGEGGSGGTSAAKQTWTLSGFTIEALSSPGHFTSCPFV